MSDTLADLFAAMKDQKQVQLTAATFGESNPAVAAFGIETLDVAVSAVSFDAGVLTLSGTASLLGLTSVSVEARAEGDAGRQVQINVVLPPGWQFPASFPILPPSLKPAAGMRGLASLQGSILGDLKFTAATLTARNSASGTLAAGLAFRGTLADASLLGWLAPVLQVSATPEIAGAIVVHPGAAPDIELKIDAPGATLGVGTFLSVDSVVVDLRTTLDEDGVEVARIELAGAVAIGKTEPVVAHVTSPFLEGSPILAFDATFDDGAVSLARGVNALAEMAGLSTSDLPLPTGPLSHIFLTEILVALDWSVPRVRHLQFAIGTDQSWTIVSGLAVSDLKMGWRVLYPFETALRDVSAGLTGTLSLGSGANPILFDVAAYSHGGFVISGSLRTGSVVSLGDIVAQAIGTDSSKLPSLDVTSLDISASTKGDFSLDATLQAWGLTIPGIALTLDQVTGTFNRTSAGPTGSIAALFTLGNVELWVSAEVPSPGAAFQFTGETYGDSQQIPLGDMTNGLTQIFKVSLPAALVQWLDSIVLTKVKVTFDDQSGNFSFVALGTLNILDSQLAIELDVAVSHDPNSPTDAYVCVTTGIVTLGTRQFTLLLEKDPAGTMLAAHYANQSGDAIDIKGLVTAASASLGAVIPDGISIGVNDVAFALSRPDTGTQIAFGLGLDASLDLTDLPLVGDVIPSDAKISVSNLHFTYSSAALDAAAVAALARAGLSLPAQGVAQGVNLSADLSLAGEKKTILLGVPAASTPAPASAATAAPAAVPASAAAPAPAPSSGAKYFDLQKQLGPISFKRIGVQYSSNVLMFLLDASIQIGPLTFSMDGLGVGSPVTRFDPQFDLAGLGLAYVQPPVEIEGALLHLPGSQLRSDTKFQFDGTLVVKAGVYSLAAIGSYAQQTNGDPSLFLFAQAEAALGGPPAFFVTGLMAGFGYNRLLRIPGQDEVLDFPLLQLASAGGQDPMAVLNLLENGTAANPKPWITPSSGDDWAAVGVEFTSFELVHSKALLIVEFGRDFQAALLGLSTMSLPQPADNSHGYVYAELELEAVLKPQDGYFGLTAILSKNSYVLTPDCHLTGGFAFSIWYGPSDHSGEFVLTLGGYHPAFQPPSYFPQVPRLGFNWAVSDDVTVKGEAYFALTTSVAMGGGGLEVLFHDGDLKAWFTAHADFLISWHPFFFLADIDLSIGVSYRVNLLFCHKTISVSVGASVHMWGPPTGGRVHVHLWIVSFTVHFGSDESAAGNTALEWTGFRNLLPKPEQVVRISAASGMYKTLDGKSDTDPKIWVVRAAEFRFNTRSAIPASALAYQAQATVTAPAKLNIRPMNRTSVDSVHTLTIFEEVAVPGAAPGAPRQWQAVSAAGWTLAPQTAAVPESLWQAPPAPFSQIPDAPAANVIEGQLVGYAVSAPAPAIGASRGLVPLEELAEDRVATGAAPVSPNVASTSAHLPAFNAGSIADIEQVAGAPAGQRTALFNLLSQTSCAGAPVYGGSDGGMPKLASAAGHLFSDAPMELA